jgi:hypothetical protein
MVVTLHLTRHQGEGLVTTTAVTCILMCPVDAPREHHPFKPPMRKAKQQSRARAPLRTGRDGQWRVAHDTPTKTEASLTGHGRLVGAEDGTRGGAG